MKIVPVVAAIALAAAFACQGSLAFATDYGSSSSSSGSGARQPPRSKTSSKAPEHLTDDEKKALSEYEKDREMFKKFNNNPLTEHQQAEITVRKATNRLGKATAEANVKKAKDEKEAAVANEKTLFARMQTSRKALDKQNKEIDDRALDSTFDHDAASEQFKVAQAAHENAFVKPYAAAQARTAAAKLKHEAAENELAANQEQLNEITKAEALTKRANFLAATARRQANRGAFNMEPAAAQSIYPASASQTRTTSLSNNNNDNAATSSTSRANTRTTGSNTGTASTSTAATNSSSATSSTSSSATSSTSGAPSNQYGPAPALPSNQYGPAPRPLVTGYTAAPAQQQPPPPPGG
jgi:hypothetical protein